MPEGRKKPAFVHDVECWHAVEQGHSLLRIARFGHSSIASRPLPPLSGHLPPLRRRREHRAPANALTFLIHSCPAQRRNIGTIADVGSVSCREGGPQGCGEYKVPGGRKGGAFDVRTRDRITSRFDILRENTQRTPPGPIRFRPLPPLRRRREHRAPANAVMFVIWSFACAAGAGAPTGAERCARGARKTGFLPAKRGA